MRTVWTLISLLLLAGCAMNQAQSEQRLDAVEKRIETLEVNQSDQAIQFTELREQPTGDDDLRAEVRRLRREVNALQQQVNSLERQAPAAPQQQHNATPEPEPIVRSDLDPEKEYTEGRRLYVAQRYSEAAAQFQAFVELFKHHELAANAQYWLGECHYDREDYLSALAEFQKVIDFYPQSKKAPDAQLKIGLCYRELGKVDQARLELQRVNRMYPGYERQSLVEDLLRGLR